MCTNRGKEQDTSKDDGNTDNHTDVYTCFVSHDEQNSRQFNLLVQYDLPLIRYQVHFAGNASTEPCGRNCSIYFVSYEWIGMHLDARAVDSLH